MKAVVVCLALVCLTAVFAETYPADGDDSTLASMFPKLNVTVSGSRDGVVQAAWAIYNNRANGHYTQGPQRWSGIDKKIRPPNAPPYSDCSAAATWCYWTQYGTGADFINGQSWKAGYTGTMTEHGRAVSLANAQPGDLVFYGNPVSHVAIFVGSGSVISHGSDPAGHYPVHYRGDYHSTRSYL